MCIPQPTLQFCNPPFTTKFLNDWNSQQQEQKYSTDEVCWTLKSQEIQQWFHSKHSTSQGRIYLGEQETMKECSVNTKTERPKLSDLIYHTQHMNFLPVIFVGSKYNDNNGIGNNTKCSHNTFGQENIWIVWHSVSLCIFWRVDVAISLDCLVAHLTMWRNIFHLCALPALHSWHTLSF